jgi:hypothetical protein
MRLFSCASPADGMKLSTGNFRSVMMGVLRYNDCHPSRTSFLHRISIVYFGVKAVHDGKLLH